MIFAYQESSVYNHVDNNDQAGAMMGMTSPAISGA